jgi:hypothetical protein
MDSLFEEKSPQPGARSTLVESDRLICYKMGWYFRKSPLGDRWG